MIYKLWLQILSIIVVIALPIIIFSHMFQKQSLEVVTSLHNNTELKTLIMDYAKAQKKLATFDRKNLEIYQNNYIKAEKTLETFSDINSVSQPLISDLSQQFFINIILVFLIGLILSFLVAKIIVNNFNKLLRKKTELEIQRAEVKNLANWQQVAKSLVHEIRAPIAPIKLIISSIEHKKEACSKPKFDEFISQASKLVLEQISYFEKMIENFTVFAKLPEPNLEKINAATFVDNLHLKYESDKNIAINSTLKTIPNIFVNIDKHLIDRLIVNIIRNSLEANAENLNSFNITISFAQNHRDLLIIIKNNGKLIPEKVLSILFSPKPSSSNGKNFGIGLIMAKKIAIDHGGDLLLSSNDELNGVAFTLQLPLETKQ